MPYVGNTPALNYTSFAVQHFTTSATTGYTLDHAVTNENDIRLVINNVVQQPGSGKAYTATGTTLTLSAATSGSDTMYCVFLGKAVQTVNPGPASVGTSQLATNAVTQAKMADDSVGTAEILDTNVTGAKLNDDAISGQGALGAEPADTDEFLVSDAGVLKRVDYSYIKGITQANFLPTASPIFYNADMQVSQRATSVTGITGSGYNVCDRMKVVGSLGTWTDIQETLTTGAAFNAGFQKAYRMDCTTAAAAPSAGIAKIFTQYFEGQDLGMFKKGTPNAETSTLAFWVKSNKTGTYQVNMLDKDNTRMCGASYTISVADTWEHKICNYAADTTGDYNNDNGRSLDIEWWLGSGTDFSSGTMPTAWEAEVSADANAAATVNVGDNIANDWAITGIQFEVGTYTSANLPPFRWETYGDNLLRCQRYYQKYMTSAQSYVNASMDIGVDGRYTTEMRATGTTMTWTLDASGNLTGGYPAVHKQRLSGSFGYQSATGAGNWYYYYDVTADAEL